MTRDRRSSNSVFSLAQDVTQNIVFQSLCFRTASQKVCAWEETRLNYIFPTYDDVVGCTYDLTRVSASVVIDILLPDMSAFPLPIRSLAFLASGEGRVRPLYSPKVISPRDASPEPLTIPPMCREPAPCRPQSYRRLEISIRL